MDHVQLGRHRVDLGAQLRRRLVHEVDGLVRQKAIRDVAVRQHRRRHQGRVLDRHLVVVLVALAQAAEDGDRVLDRRLIDHDRLEAPLQGRVLFDVLAVLVQRRGADAVQLAARQHRLEQIAGVHRALGLARADDRVQFVDEQDDLAVRLGDFLQHRLEPLLELAAVLGAGDQGAHVQGDHALALQPLRHVLLDDALGEAFDDGRLADARLADEDGVVLGAPRQHLHDAADLVVAADDRVELVVAGGLRQVAAVLLQGLERALRVLRRDALASSHGFHGLQ